MHAAFLETHVLSIPLRVRFRGIDHREVMLVRGAAGWAEFSPFLEYEVPEASRWLASALEIADEGLPQGGVDAVEINATVPAVDASQVPAVLARFPGARTAKVKVAQEGQALEDDVARVAAVRAALGEGGHVRVDANAAWDGDEALAALTALAPFRLQYAEQPVAGIEGLARLRERLAARGLHVPLAADESIRKAEDPLRVAALGAADVVILKVQPLGGVRAALEVARAAGLPTVVSSALDTSVGISAGLALASVLPPDASGVFGAERPACGLGTVGLMASDVLVEPLTPRGGRLPVGPVSPDPDRLEALAAPPARRDWWHARLAACLEFLDP